MLRSSVLSSEEVYSARVRFLCALSLYRCGGLLKLDSGNVIGRDGQHVNACMLFFAVTSRVEKAFCCHVKAQQICRQQETSVCRM